MSLGGNRAASMVVFVAMIGACCFVFQSVCGSRQFSSKLIPDITHIIYDVVCGVNVASPCISASCHGQ